MELKRICSDIIDAVWDSFNRTFMELKLDHRDSASTAVHVLIGPSWN